MKATMTVGELTTLLQRMPEDTQVKAVYKNYYDREDTACLNSIELLYDDSNMTMVLHLKEADTSESSNAA